MRCVPWTCSGNRRTFEQMYPCVTGLTRDPPTAIIAGGILVESWSRLREGSPPPAISLIPFVVLAIDIAVNFWRARALHRTARDTKSQALAADALHFASDVLGSIAVVTARNVIHAALYLVIALASNDPRYDTLYLSNYATINVIDAKTEEPAWTLDMDLGVRPMELVLMGAASCDVPAIVVSGGPMLNGWHKGQRTGSGTIIWKARE